VRPPHASLVHLQLAELRAAGGGVLLVSEDLDGLMQLCDRILVMYRGRMASEFSRAEFDAYRLGRHDPPAQKSRTK
jgi:simple sugar transport system ATP-binding protein